MDNNARKKPNCPLIGADGNIFNLVGIASRRRIRNVKNENNRSADYTKYN